MDAVTDPLRSRAVAGGSKFDSGRGNSLSDWVSDWLDETGELNAIPENLRNYFDYDAYARDLELGGDVFTVRHNGETWVFWNR